GGRSGGDAASVAPREPRGDQQVRPVGALRHGALDHVDHARLRGRENTVGVSQLLHDHGDSVDIPRGSCRGGDPNRVLLRLDHDFVTAGGDERDVVGGEVNDSHVLSCCVVGVLGVVDQVVGLVDLCGELGGEGVVQVLTVGVLVEDGGVGENAGAALGGGALREDRDLAVDVDGEDGQVAELCGGEGVDVVGGDEVHDPVLPVGPWGCSPGRRVWGRSPNLVTPSLAS